MMIKNTLSAALLMLVTAGSSAGLSGVAVPGSITGQPVAPSIHTFVSPGGGGLLACPLWAEQVICEPFVGSEDCGTDFVSCIASAVTAADGEASAVARFAFKACQACENTTEPVGEEMAELAMDVCEVSQCSFPVCADGPSSKALMFCRSDAELDACRSACADRVGQ